MLESALKSCTPKRCDVVFFIKCKDSIKSSRFSIQRHNILSFYRQVDSNASKTQKLALHLAMLINNKLAGIIFYYYYYYNSNGLVLRKK